MIDLNAIEGFDWDEGNAYKSLDKHAVTQTEAEQVFTSEVLISADVRHSDDEPRYQALGMTIVGRLLHVTFTLRDGGRKVRIISARPMNRKERTAYEQSS